MKKIGIFLKFPLITDYPFTKPEYRQSYKELSAEIEKLGVESYIVRGQATYQGEGKFSNSWRYQNSELVESGPVQVDLVVDRGEFKTDEKVKMFNHPYINELCTDKWLMYQKFSQYCPATFVVKNPEELAAAFQKTTTELVVVKPVDGQEGEGVVIAPVAELRQKQFEFPILVQDFLDSSGGVPGIVEGLHDFRIAIVDGEPTYSYFRTPPKNSYLANVARGGRFSMVPLDKLPAAAVEIVKAIDAELAQYGHRFYGIDFAFTTSGPKIIEMNSRLGLLPNEDDPAFVVLKQKLAAIFADMVK